jgi:hypothetical protein
MTAVQRPCIDAGALNVTGDGRPGRTDRSRRVDDEDTQEGTGEAPISSRSCSAVARHVCRLSRMGPEDVAGRELATRLGIGSQTIRSCLIPANDTSASGTVLRAAQSPHRSS